MSPNLKLVENLDLLPHLRSGMKNPFVVRNLVPKHHQTSVQISNRRSSYSMLSVVMLAHIVGLVWLINAKPALPDMRELLSPMTVSLIVNHAPEPEVVSSVPIPPLQSVIKKLKPITKKNLPTSEPIAEQLLTTPHIVDSEAPSQPAPAAPVIATNAPEIVEIPEPKIEHDPIIEPPRFGATYLHNPAPDYPPLARRFGEQGRVVLRVLVSINGATDSVQIESSSGSDKLDQAAIQAVKKWSFIPAKRNNQSVSAYVLVPVKFSLDS